MRSDDLAPQFNRPPPSGVGFRQGTVLAWDSTTADSVVEVGGTIVSNLTVLSASEVKVIQPGDRVSILTLGEGAKTWFILGKVTVPGGAELAIVQSADYVPATSGYSVNRDGTAEFQDITARGDLVVNSLLAGVVGGARVELTPTNFLQVFDGTDTLIGEFNAANLIIRGPNGSRVSLFPAFVSGALTLAAVTFQPTTPVSPDTITSPGAAYAFTGVGNTPTLQIVPPALNSGAVPNITMYGENAASDPTRVTVGAGIIQLAAVDGTLFLITSNGNDVQISSDGDVVIDAVGNINISGDVNITGGLSASGAGGTKTAFKPSDETVNNSATLQNDDHLTVAVAANAVYQVDLYAIYNSNSTANLKVDYTMPTGAALSPMVFISGGTLGNIQHGVSLGTVGAIGGIAGTGANAGLQMHGVLTTGANAGSLTFRWAQNTANASDTIMRAGSRLVLIRLA